MKVINHLKVAKIFRDSGIGIVGDMERVKPEALIIINPYEFLIDMPKPTTHQLKYVGCVECFKQAQPVDFEKLFGFLNRMVNP